MIAAGTIVDGRYEITSSVGEGGMCCVYKARHLELQRDVALKLLHARLLTDVNAVTRFRREALAASSLEHPHIVKVYGFGIYDQTPYMAMERPGHSSSRSQAEQHHAGWTRTQSQDR